MNGVVFGDASGIDFNGGTLVVENSVIAGFGNGIHQATAGSNLIVNNCEFRNTDYGVDTATFSDTNSNTAIENSRFEYNSSAVRSEFGTVNLSIRNSVLTNNVIGVHAASASPTRPVLILVDTCTIIHNGYGMNAYASAGGSPSIRDR